jgi:3-oxoacyl-[acyl-carrier protein] reductase
MLSSSPRSPIVRRALVTGASSGIGEAIASRLLVEGWDVIGMSRSTSIAGARFQFLETNLLDVQATESSLDKVGHVDVLVHAAGFLRVNPIGDLQPQDGYDMWRLHVDAALQMINRVAPTMSNGGRIILIGSRALFGAAGRSQYAATKAALLGLVRSCALEFAQRGVTVNVISPATTDTAMLRDPARASVTPKIPPIGRLIRPQEVAALTNFLISEDAACITGQNINICGGASI